MIRWSLVRVHPAPPLFTLRFGYLNTRGLGTIVLRDEIATSFLGLVGVDALAVAAEARAEPVPGEGP